MPALAFVFQLDPGLVTDEFGHILGVGLSTCFTGKCGL